MDAVPPEMAARHEAELDLVAGALAERYETRLVEAGGELPVPTLLVALGADEEGRDRTMGVSFMPFDDEFAATEFLQFYVHVPIEVPADKLDEVRCAATIVNAHLAVGHFALRDGQVYYRYVLACPAGDLVDADLLGELVPLLEYHQEHFGDYLEGVATDNVSLVVLDKVVRESLA
jgi:hypothetical protein